VNGKRGVFAALAGATLLAVVLLGFGVLQLVRIAARSELGGIETFGFALVLGATALVLPAAVGWFAYRALDRQVESLTAEIDATPTDGTHRAIVVEGSGAAGELASATTRIVAEFADRVEAGHRESRLLQSVVGAMKEGMVVLGPDRKIRVANEAFRQLFRTPFEPVGRLLAEVVRDPAVFRELEASLPPGGEIRESLLHLPGSGRSFELRVSPLSGNSADESVGALILFFDVTRLEALERVRREFVADVSHELRTPLTSIKAFVENLMEERLVDRDESLRFLEIVRKHTDRMGALIDDLTDLSLIETGAVTLDMAPIDVHELARDVVAQFAFRAESAGVAVRLDLPSPFPLLADHRRLWQVLVNLVDNGIKFSHRGGAVVIAGDVREGRPRITVTDTGVGIPPEALEQVFHRFFRADKARSRELGGTGLGLAIVKHLMRLHGGQVSVVSELGRGATFTLEFPPPPRSGGSDQGLEEGSSLRTGTGGS
jgi:two-component system, OmpR family, phosphate regulon sensor histidine kinase PhoR